jgi:DNA-binding NtrC family response regulator
MKIIVLSGQNDADNARHARTLGAIDFVGKPCDPGHLLALFSPGHGFRRAPPPSPTAGLIGDSLPMQRLRLQLGSMPTSTFPSSSKANRAAARTSSPATTCTS